MPHAIMKLDNNVFFIEYSGDDYDYLLIEGIYLQNSQVNLVEYMSDAILSRAQDEVYQDYFDLIASRNEYLRDMQLEMREATRSD